MSIKNKIGSIASVAFVISIPFFDLPKWGIDGISVSIFPAIVVIMTCWRSVITAIPRFLILAISSFIAFYSISLIINQQNIDDRAFRHVIYYSLTFSIFYLTTILSITVIGAQYFRVLLYYGLCILLLVGIAELSVYFIFGYEAYANFLDHGKNVGTFLDHVPRMRSLFNEPSHMALYVAAVAPIVWNLGFAARFVVIIILVMTFSTSLFLGLLISGIGIILFELLRPNGVARRITVTIFATAIAFVMHQYIDDVFGKLINIQQADKTRFYAFIDSLEYISSSIFIGHGPTFYYNYAELGLFNWYLQLYIESGILGLASMLIFILGHTIFVWRCMGAVGVYFFSSVLIQYFGMNHYYLPGLWVLLAFSLFNYEGSPNGNKIN